MCAVSYFGFDVHDVHSLCPRSAFGDGGIWSMGGDAKGKKKKCLEVQDAM
jgi:hypothetical protein